MSQAHNCPCSQVCVLPGAPGMPFEPNSIEPGIWLVIPVCSSDHMSLQGGMIKRDNIRPFYPELPELIDTLPKKQKEGAHAKTRRKPHVHHSRRKKSPSQVPAGRAGRRQNV